MRVPPPLGAPEAPALPGYDIVRSIGHGGMGEVFQAVQVALGRPVAIKRLHGLDPRDDTAHERIARFRREAELMARVSHPNVVAVHDLLEAEGRLYMVMEYIEGGDLRTRMLGGIPLPVDRVRKIIGPVVSALATLHGQGIVHRDLKPENILMAQGEQPKVADFGIAVLNSNMGSLTESGLGLGTPGYVAPEQQYNLKVDERADQYSLAAVAYELLTGLKPFGVLKPPSTVVPTLSTELDAVMVRALQEDPADRFPTITEFGSALERGLGGRRLWDSPWALLALAGLALLALAIWEIAGGLWHHLGPPPPPPPGPRGGPGGPPPFPPPQAPAVPSTSRRVPQTLVAEPIGMTLVRIPAGEFQMGSPDTEEPRPDAEKPAHSVTISRDFYLSATEVTIGQFRRFVDATGYVTVAERNNAGGYVPKKRSSGADKTPGTSWRQPGYEAPPRDDLPVTQVTWDDAMAFCRWLSENAPRHYRLPTEAEWEYACRAGTITPWSSGDSEKSLSRAAWFRRNLAPDDGPHPVGRLDPNPFHLHDMHGNVMEWCLDGQRIYPHNPTTDPRGPTKDVRRAIRGGSWSRPAEQARSASRLQYRHDYPHAGLGFRLCSPDGPTDRP